MPALEKEVITNMYKQPRSMTPDDNVVLQADSQGDLQIGQAGQQPAAHRNSVSVQLNNQQNNLLGPSSNNAFNVNPAPRQAQNGDDTTMNQAAGNSHFNFSGQANSQMGDPKVSKAAGSSVSPASNALG